MIILIYPIGYFRLLPINKLGKRLLRVLCMLRSFVSNALSKTEGTIVARVSNSTGQALIELAICLPFLALLCFGVVEFARSANIRFDAEVIASAGVDTLNRLAGLEQGTFTNLTPYSTCGSPASTTKCAGHLLAQDRMRTLITSMMGEQFDSSTLIITTGYQACPNSGCTIPSSDSQSDTVWTAIEFRHISPLLMNVLSNVYAENQGPYLYTQNIAGWTPNPPVLTDLTPIGNDNFDVFKNDVKGFSPSGMISFQDGLSGIGTVKGGESGTSPGGGKGSTGGSVVFLRSN